jgi:hypothetical protein
VASILSANYKSIRDQSNLVSSGVSGIFTTIGGQI